MARRREVLPNIRGRPEFSKYYRAMRAPVGHASSALAWKATGPALQVAGETLGINSPDIVVTPDF